MDANVLVDVFSGALRAPERLAGSQWVLRAAQRSQHRVVLPASVIAETVGASPMRPERPGDREVRAERVERFLRWVRNSRPLIVDIDRRVAERGARLAQAHELKGGDAMVLAAALIADCRVLYTWDRQDLVKLDGREGLEGLRILEPEPILPPQTEIDVRETTSQPGG